jgi:hypothetical protein
LTTIIPKRQTPSEYPSPRLNASSKSIA